MTPQVTIFLSPDGHLYAEAPLGAVRQRLELPLGFAKGNPEIMEALQAQATLQKAQEAAALAARRRDNIAYMAAKHPRLGAKIYGKEFERALLRKTRGDEPPKAIGNAADLGI